MLKNISPLISPELLAKLHKMGHGDEIVFADAHFPGYTFCDTVFRADGIEVPDLLKGVLPLFELDQFVDDKVIMMQAVEGDKIPDGLLDEYKACFEDDVKIHFIDRFAFYERTKKASCVVMCGTTRKYGCIILKKGVTPLV